MAISWDKYFMEIAKLSAQRSKDPKTQVGAVIVSPVDNHIISVGYNGMPRGIDDNIDFCCREPLIPHASVWNDEIKNKLVVHAEANAILNTNEDLHGATMYITQYPCNECAKLIVQKGIKKIVYADTKFERKEGVGEFSKFILASANVLTEYYYEEE